MARSAPGFNDACYQRSKHIYHLLSNNRLCMLLQDISGRSFRTLTAPSAHYGEVLAKREEEAQQQEFDHSKMT